MSTPACPTGATMMRPPVSLRSCGGYVEPIKRPASRLHDGRFGIVKQPAQRRDQVGAPALAGGYRGVADHPAATDPLDRGPGKDLTKARIVECKEVGERRGDKLGAGHKRLVAARAVGKAIPGADCQAIVAAIDAIADRLAKLVRDRPFVPDGKI